MKDRQRLAWGVQFTGSITLPLLLWRGWHEDDCASNYYEGEPTRLLDFVENFILFSEHKTGSDTETGEPKENNSPGKSEEQPQKHDRISGQEEPVEGRVVDPAFLMISSIFFSSRICGSYSTSVVALT